MAVMKFPKWEHVAGWLNWGVSLSKNKENKD